MACAFCEIVSRSEPAEIVLETETSVGFLDVRPLFPGHTLIVPRLHHETLADVPVGAVGPLFGDVQVMQRSVEAFGAQGAFVAVNNRVSQSVPHVHIHVVPRTKGDGLKGFFWPRQKYRDDQHRAEVGAALRNAVTDVMMQS